jgi:hypothetical protein
VGAPGGPPTEAVAQLIARRYFGVLVPEPPWEGHPAPLQPADRSGRKRWEVQPLLEQPKRFQLPLFLTSI